MSRPVEQALTALVPSLNGPLPPQLVNVATALVAQSRSKASTLKSEEEIARVYACCHLACERSKQTLNLPQIVPRPPIPPRLYKKVYNYFDTALTTQASKTPTKRAREEEPSESLPRKRTATAAGASNTSTPVKATPRKRATPVKAKDNVSAGDEEAPSWIMPIIRQLCKALDAPAAPPHVYAGVCSALRLQNSKSTAAVGSRTRTRRSEGASAPPEAVAEAQIPPLIAAILFYTMLRLTGREITGDEQSERLDKAVDTLGSCEACQEQTPDEIARWIEHYMALAPAWLEMEWFQNIAEGSGLGIHGTTGATEEDDTSQGDRNLGRSATATPQKKRKAPGMDGGARVLRNGVGTMMQAKLDYLSDERQADFLQWKEGLLARIEQIEERQASKVSAS